MRGKYLVKSMNFTKYWFCLDKYCHSCVLKQRIFESQGRIFKSKMKVLNTYFSKNIELTLS